MAKNIIDAEITDTTAKRKRKSTKDPSKAPKHTDINKILKQRKKNPLMTITDQAKLNGIDKSALSRLLKRHGIDANAVQEYKESRADLFAGKQELVLTHINESAIKRIVEKHPQAAVALFGTLFDKERLERGLSTQNSAVILASAVIAASNMPVDNSE